MKRFLPILTLFLAGCISGPRPIDLAKTPVAEAPQRLPEPIVVQHDPWSIELPPEWKYDDVPQTEDGNTQLLVAESLKKEGRVAIQLSINSSLFEGADFLFGEAAAVLIQKIAPEEDQRLLSQRRVMINGRPGTLSVMVNSRGIATGVLAVGVHQVGYLVSCGGDALGEHGKVVSQTCVKVMSTFKVK